MQTCPGFFLKSLLESPEMVIHSIDLKLLSVLNAFIIN